MKNNTLKLIINWLAVVAWLAIIFYFSHQPNLKSELEPLLDLILRKIAHLAEYFVLSFLLFRAYYGLRTKSNEALIFSLIGSVFFAGLDEYNQSSVAGRVGSLKDVGIDSLGSLAFAGLKLYEKKKLL